MHLLQMFICGHAACSLVVPRFSTSFRRHLTTATCGVSDDDSPNSELKASVVRGVNRAARGKESIQVVIDDIKILEKLNPSPRPTESSLLNGTWSLIGTYSTDGGQTVAPAGSVRSQLQIISDAIYENIYKNSRWSWLAGANSGSSAARSYQNIDTSCGKIVNIVEFSVPAPSFFQGSSLNGRITVDGSLEIRDFATLQVVFESTTIEVDAPRFLPMAFLDADDQKSSIKSEP